MQEAFQLMNTLAQVGPPEEALTGDIYDGTNEMSFLSPPEQLSENTRSLNFRLLEHGIFFEIIPAVDNARQVIPGQYLVGLFAIRWSATFDGTRVFCERAKPDSQAYFNNSEIRGYRSARYNSRLDDVFIHAGGKARMPAGEVASNAIHEIEHSIANILFPYLDPVSSEELAYLSEIANQGSPEKRERVFRDSFDTALITAIFGEDISSPYPILVHHGF